MLAHRRSVRKPQIFGAEDALHLVRRAEPEVQKACGLQGSAPAATYFAATASRGTKGEERCARPWAPARAPGGRPHPRPCAAARPDAGRGGRRAHRSRARSCSTCLFCLWWYSANRKVIR